jgi:hypothetical protein
VGSIEAMIDEAGRRFEIRAARVVHRVGSLQAQDQIVLVAVARNVWRVDVAARRVTPKDAASRSRFAPVAVFGSVASRMITCPDSTSN